jgi:prefoldin subunit 5
MLRLRDAAKVLDQRKVQIAKHREDLQQEIKEIHFEITQLSVEDDIKKIHELEQIIKEKEEELHLAQKI